MTYLYAISLILLFITTLGIAGIIVFKNQPTVIYTYTKDEISSNEISNNINLL